MPSATSSAIDPVGITSMGARASSPSRMIEPRPNCRSIWASAVSRDFSLSPALPPALSLPAMDTPVGIMGFLSGPTLRAAADKTPRTGPLKGPRHDVPRRRPLLTLGEQLFDHEGD